MKNYVPLVISACVWLAPGGMPAAYAQEPPAAADAAEVTDDALAERFMEIVREAADCMEQVITALSLIRDEDSLRQVAPRMQLLRATATRLDEAKSAMKEELSRREKNLPDITNGGEMISRARFLSLQWRIRLIPLVTELNQHLNAGDFGDPEQAIQTLGSVPYMWFDFADPEKRHADTAQWVQGCINGCEYLATVFEECLQKVTDTESADEATHTVLEVKRAIPPAQQLMDAYASDDPEGYEPLREESVERIMRINDRFIRAARRVLAQDCYGSAELRRLLSDYAQMSATAPETEEEN